MPFQEIRNDNIIFSQPRGQVEAKDFSKQREGSFWESFGLSASYENTLLSSIARPKKTFGVDPSFDLLKHAEDISGTDFMHQNIDILINAHSKTQYNHLSSEIRQRDKDYEYMAENPYGAFAGGLIGDFALITYAIIFFCSYAVKIRKPSTILKKQHPSNNSVEVAKPAASTPLKISIFSASIKLIIKVLYSFLKSPWLIAVATTIIFNMVLSELFDVSPRCKDGSFSSAIGSRGACSYHGGVDRGAGGFVMLSSICIGIAVYLSISNILELREWVGETLKNLFKPVNANKTLPNAKIKTLDKQNDLPIIKQPTKTYSEEEMKKIVEENVIQADASTNFIKSEIKRLNEKKILHPKRRKTNRKSRSTEFKIKISPEQAAFAENTPALDKEYELAMEIHYREQQQIFEEDKNTTSELFKGEPFAFKAEKKD